MKYKWLVVVLVIAFIALSLIFTDGNISIKVFDFERKMIAPLVMLIYTGLGFLLAFLTR
jgi:hypothetical protein